MLQDLHDLKYMYGMCSLLSLAKFSHKPKHTHTPAKLFSVSHSDHNTKVASVYTARNTHR